MAVFMIRFFICSIFISGIIGILLLAKRIFKNILSSRMQYNLWFLLLGLLAVPFLPVQPIGLPDIFSWLGNFLYPSVSTAGAVADETAALVTADTGNWMNDFTLSVSRETSSATGTILWGIWIAGILVMLLLLAKSMVHFNALKKSALPLQNKEIRRLYQSCLDEMKITRHIPIHSTAFLKSPIIAGLFQPCIYLPIHLISDHDTEAIRYMLLHELQHYKYKDALINYLMNLAVVFYWFHPLVWYALKEMRNDREVACDTSVLNMLEEVSYKAYGCTLINFAEKLSQSPFPFTSGIGSSMKQMKKRIQNIASYTPPSFCQKLKSALTYSIIALLLLCLAPVLSIYAAEETSGERKEPGETSADVDLSSYFKDYEGCFVLYDSRQNTWKIYNREHAATRIAPASTYKIYDALFALEEGIITPAQSQIAWNGQIYPFESWNREQNLDSAMASSVTWYFQALDMQLGLQKIKEGIRSIQYGNQKVTEDISSYWLESALKISPLEQVALLKKFYRSELPFAPEHIQTVKDSLLLSSASDRTLYGKTGTGQVNGQNTNGWFVGYVENPGCVSYFAVNIQGKDAAGTTASEIALSILSDWDIWH